MTIHVLKMVWNRRRQNGLMAAELFVSFLVLFAVCAIAIHYLDLWRQPLGFSGDGVLSLQLRTTTAIADDQASARGGARFAEMVRQVEALPEVEAAASAHWAPFTNSSYLSVWTAGGRKHTLRLESVTDHFDRVMRLEMIRGRWFDASDSADPRRAVVINERLAREAFGREEAVGRVLVDEPGQRAAPGERAVEMRVVGVVRDYREGGHFAAPVSFAFVRTTPAEADLHLACLLVRLRPGTPAVFEETLIGRLHLLAPDWSVQARSVEQLREQHLRESLAPLLVFALVVGFLMLMVALGVVGVVWQNVTQRTREIGLRRAKGATGRDVARQVLGELLVVAALGIALGVVVVAQLPVSGWLPDVAGRVYALAVLATGATLTALTALAGLYPSWLASRVQPAEALRYE